MPTAKTEIISSSDIVAASGAYGNRSPTIQSGFISSFGVAIEADTDATATDLKFKVQVLYGSDWIDLYRDNAGTFELEEYTIPLVANTAGQFRSIRLAADSMRDLRLDFQGVGGVATVKSIRLQREAPRING